MSQSNHRIKEPNTVHHLTSRIAHRIYFLKDDERNDFLSFVLRVTEFSGVKLLGWCIMTNHFHLLVYLPEPEFLSDEEIRRRYDILKGIGANLSLKTQEEIEKQRHRMYNIADYMKMIKQWFSEDYNRRNGHKGTMWEATYGDVPVDKTTRAMVERLANTATSVNRHKLRVLRLPSPSQGSRVIFSPITCTSLFESKAYHICACLD